ncbi:hypothetical protein WSM22_35840 [Cytophagales bacterium WSM2-2]|nr:hypothetical protein WSM22_35840 [Cytophagales bacterium WSM2-2]
MLVDQQSLNLLNDTTDHYKFIEAEELAIFKIKLLVGRPTTEVKKTNKGGGSLNASFIKSIKGKYFDLEEFVLHRDIF